MAQEERVDDQFPQERVDGQFHMLAQEERVDDQFGMLENCHVFTYPLVLVNMLLA